MSRIYKKGEVLHSNSWWFKRSWASSALSPTSFFNKVNPLLLLPNPASFKDSLSPNPSPNLSKTSTSFSCWEPLDATLGSLMPFRLFYLSWLSHGSGVTIYLWQWGLLGGVQLWVEFLGWWCWEKCKGTREFSKNGYIFVWQVNNGSNIGSMLSILLFYPLLETGSLFLASFISAFNSFFLIPLVPIML